MNMNDTMIVTSIANSYDSETEFIRNEITQYLHELCNRYPGQIHLILKFNDTVSSHASKGNYPS